MNWVFTYPFLFLARITSYIMEYNFKGEIEMDRRELLITKENLIFTRVYYLKVLNKSMNNYLNGKVTKKEIEPLINKLDDVMKMVNYNLNLTERQLKLM